MRFWQSSQIMLMLHKICLKSFLFTMDKKLFRLVRYTSIRVLGALLSQTKKVYIQFMKHCKQYTKLFQTSLPIKSKWGANLPSSSYQQRSELFPHVQLSELLHLSIHGQHCKLVILWSIWKSDATQFFETYTKSIGSGSLSKKFTHWIGLISLPLLISLQMKKHICCSNSKC